MGDTSETNTKVLSRDLFLGVVALKLPKQKFIICATWALFPGTITYIMSNNAYVCDCVCVYSLIRIIQLSETFYFNPGTEGFSARH